MALETARRTVSRQRARDPIASGSSGFGLTISSSARYGTESAKYSGCVTVKCGAKIVRFQLWRRESRVQTVHNDRRDSEAWEIWAVATSLKWDRLAVCPSCLLILRRNIDHLLLSYFFTSELSALT
jgi:hypothetical protein